MAKNRRVGSISKKTEMSAREKALNDAMKLIDFGKGSIMRLGDEYQKQKVQVMSSGSLALDIALVLVVIKRSDHQKIYGPEII